MDVKLFHEFAMVVKHGNLSEAARELNTTQSALSRHLSAIEKEFNTKLFSRLKSPMELTPEGEYFLEKSNSILNEYSRLSAHFLDIKNVCFDTLSIGGVLESRFSLLFLKAKRRLQEERPYLTIKIADTSFQTPFDSLRNGSMDIAIEPISGMIDLRNLESLHLFYEQPLVVVERDHPYASRESIDAGDLGELAFTSLRSNRGHALRKHLQDMCRINGIDGARPGGLAIASVNSYTQLFLQGLADRAVMLPKSMALRYIDANPDLYCPIEVKDKALYYDMRAFYRSNPEDKVKWFLASLQDVNES